MTTKKRAFYGCLLNLTFWAPSILTMQSNDLPPLRSANFFELMLANHITKAGKVNNKHQLIDLYRTMMVSSSFRQACKIKPLEIDLSSIEISQDHAAAFIKKFPLIQKITIELKPNILPALLIAHCPWIEEVYLVRYNCKVRCNPMGCFYSPSGILIDHELINKLPKTLHQFKIQFFATPKKASLQSFFCDDILIPSYRYARTELFPGWENCIDDDAVALLVARCPHLNTLHIPRSYLSEESIDHINQLNELVSLDIRGCNLSRQAIQKILEKHEQLEELGIDYYEYDEQQNGEVQHKNNIEDLPKNIKHLALSGIPFGQNKNQLEAQIKFRCPKLETFELCCLPQRLFVR